MLIIYIFLFLEQEIKQVFFIYAITFSLPAKTY